MTQTEKARLFASLHVRGNPLVLYNAWDAGSAEVVAAAGAKAIATGSASVAGAQGFKDAETLPIELAFANAERVVGAVDLPVTVDFEGAYAVEPQAVASNMARLKETGAIGCNFEDQVIGGEGIHPAGLQAERISAARAAVGADFFINARTDIFLKAKRETHVEQALERGQAYAEAGASGLFIPGLIDLKLVARFCERSRLPVNFMGYPGAPPVKELARTGVARISYGPFPWKLAMKALREAAEAVYG
jgi:2-methylisocitrate lyase-like PEP mutase family enzyme